VSSDKPLSPVDRFSAAVRDATEQFERHHRAEIIAAGGDPDGDRDPLDQVRNIADDYTRHKDRPEALAEFLGLLADELDLADVHALRLAAEAAALITPRLIHEAADEGRKAPDIADELGVTESYVYRVLRQQKAASDDVTGEAPPVDEHRLSTRDQNQ
jgi:hypothetical protein